MPQSLTNIVVHLIFQTKNRLPMILDDIQDELNAYMCGILKTYDCTPIIANTEPEHAHIMFVLSKNHALAEVIENVKKGSSKWIKGKGARYTHFYWQSGYGAFSVSESMIETVKQYIANQREHHQKISFQDELRKLFEEHGVKYDERYLWD